MAASERHRQIGAAVDLGATSVHLLIGRVEDHRVEPMVDESAFLGLGEAAGRGVLGGVDRQPLVDALAHFAWMAREADADVITFVGTEPLRRLLDAARIVDDIAHATGVGLHVLDHEEEGYLTLIGVTEGRRVERRLLVVDVGGGSTELVTIGPDERPVAAGVRIGAAALTSRIVSADPPTADELEQLRTAAAEALAAAPDAAPDDIVVVGGTASNLLKLGRDRGDGGDDRTLDRPALAHALRVVARSSADEVAADRGLRPARARIIAAGAAIVGAVLDRYAGDRVRVATGGIREGTVLATLHAGPGWRDRLAELARGWITPDGRSER